jgi:CubicO group peptidase (beta-lactamase class C family)
MKWIKRIGAVIALLVMLVVLAGGGLYAWLLSGVVGVPDSAAGALSETRVYDDEYLPAIEEARVALAQARVDLNAPAVSVAISVGGDPVWAEALGYADVETLEPVTLTSRFTIGSVSKTITATAAAALAEEGALDLDEDVHAYVPDYPALPYPLSLRQLLSHQGGIRHYAFAMTPPIFTESGLNEQFDTAGEALTLFQDDALLFEPDTGFAYSTFGYTLASAVMEGASGEAFLEILQARVFDPAGMANTSADYRDRPVPGRVSDYLTLKFVDGLLPAPETNNSYKWAGGGLVSTPSDLVRFGDALLAGRLVSAEMREVMFTPRTLSNGEINPQYYGLGWRSGGLSYPRGSENYLTMINHGGTSIGGTAILILLPEQDIVIALTANVTPPGGSGPLRTDAANIARIFMDHMGEP